MRKIEALIVGAQKAGTTSLKEYLSQHLRIVTPYSVECSFFHEHTYGPKGFERFATNHLPSIKRDSIVLAKNANIYYDRNILLRVKEHNPNIKVIFILRNPVERVFSSFCMENRSEVLPESL